MRKIGCCKQLYVDCCCHVYAFSCWFVKCRLAIDHLSHGESMRTTMRNLSIGRVIVVLWPCASIRFACRMYGIFWPKSIVFLQMIVPQHFVNIACFSSICEHLRARWFHCHS